MNEYGLEIIPEAQFLNLLGNFLLDEKPDAEKVKAIGEISANVDFPEFRQLSEIAKRIIETNDNWERFIQVFNHHFIIPAACALPLYTSALFFSRIKPDFYREYLRELGLDFKLKGRNFPDHIGNELVLLSIILSISVMENNESSIKLGRQLLRKFFIPHLNAITSKVSSCTCDDELNLYKPLFKCIKILYEETKNVMARMNNAQ